MQKINPGEEPDQILSVASVSSSASKARRNRKDRQGHRVQFAQSSAAAESDVGPQLAYNSVEAHLFAEWSKRIIEDDMFDGEEDESEWMIDDTKVLEVIEALNY